MRQYTFEERHPPGDGPWADEPDKAQWVDTTTGLDCLAVRARSGAWCGYVGVPPGHPWHGHYADHLRPDPVVHGGITFTGLCQEGSEDGPGVCHVPEPGRPAEVWWVGFDMSHAEDCCPTYEARELGLTFDLHRAPVDAGFRMPHVYRTFGDVQDQVRVLAVQAAAVSSPVS